MTWSYSGDPASSTLDQVRFLVRDTASTHQLVQDEEINWLLTQEANVYMAAAATIDTLILTRYGVLSRSAGDVSVTYMEPIKLVALSQMLRRRGMGHQVPSVGGISIADKLSQEIDPDRVQLPIALGNMDNRFAGANTPLTDPTQPVLSGG